MQINNNFCASYQALENEMQSLAEADGDVYLPNLDLNGPADYILICMEPSLGRWARNAEEARSKVKAGFRNFIYSIEDFILHFCVRRYLCGPEQRYHLTDLSKGAMLVKHAGVERVQRYNRWYSLLVKELDLVSTPNAKFIAVGGAVAEHLIRRGFSRPLTQIIHYSGLAASARKAGIIGHESNFESFRTSVKLADLITTAEDVLKHAQVSSPIKEEILVRLDGHQLSESRLQLIYNYKVAFESM